MASEFEFKDGDFILGVWAAWKDGDVAYVLLCGQADGVWRGKLVKHLYYGDRSTKRFTVRYDTDTTPEKIIEENNRDFNELLEKGGCNKLVYAEIDSYDFEVARRKYNTVTRFVPGLMED